MSNNQLRRSWPWIAAAALCFLHIWMAASVSRTFSTTVDEIAHLTAGYSYATRSDYRLQPENGIFPQRWCALPLLAQDVTFPDTDGNAWVWADIWRMGDEFFHKEGNNLPDMLAAGRSMNAVLSGALCFCVFVLARGLYGPRAALVALVLAAFSPTLLAHGGLITSDTAAGLGFAVVSLAWWWLLQRITIARVLLAGGALGLLAVSKYSAVLFLPVMLVTAALRAARSKAIAWGIVNARLHAQGITKIILLLVTGGLVAFVATAMIWSAYGFRYSATPAGVSPNLGFAQPWDTVLLKGPPHHPMIMADGRALEAIDAKPGLMQKIVGWARDHRLLPEAYLYGFAFVVKHSRGRLAFFAGDYRISGWWEFFPTAFVLKTTLPALALMALGLIGIGHLPPQRRRVWLYRVAPLLILFFVYWGFAITSRLNIGHRHLLPIYPICYVFAAASVFLILRHRRWLWPVVGMLLWHIGESLAIRPDYLAYFNPLAGGPRQAHHLFVDSSLDWGQDLPRLHNWLTAHRSPNEPVYLSYFGSGSPPHEGIVATRFGDGYFDQAPRVTPPLLTGGLYCISATMLQRVYTDVRGPWSPSYEKSYQELRAWLSHLSSQPAGQKPTETDGSPLAEEFFRNRLSAYEQLQFGRLCYYLQMRGPDDRVGYTMFIFRLSEAEINFALYAPMDRVSAAVHPQALVNQ